MELVRYILYFTFINLTLKMFYKLKNFQVFELTKTDKLPIFEKKISLINRNPVF